MKIVIDTSVVIAVITNESHKAELISLTTNADLVAPGCIQWEVGNAFSAMFKRRRINFEEANAAIEFFRQIPLILKPVDLGKSLEIAYNHKIYAYDAYFLTCSIAENASLLTLDKGMRTTARNLNIKIIEVS